jgi:tetratricopeptide (TPR) repeat protein
VRAAPGADGPARWLAVLAADGVAQSLRERLMRDVLRCDGAPPDPPVLIVTVGCEALDGPQVGLRLDIARDRPERQIWSGAQVLMQRGAPPIESPDARRLIFEAAEAVLRNSSPPPALRADAVPPAGTVHPDDMLSAAIDHAFSMEPERLLTADALLREAGPIRGLINAWRAQVRVIQFVERHPGDPRGFREEGERFARRAVEDEPGNSTVLAIMSNVRQHLFGDTRGSLEYARRAVELNPSNPLALWSRASANLYAGEHVASHGDAVLGRHLMGRARNRFFWDNQLFGAEMMLGRLDRATELLEGVRSQRPGFRPPHRYLIALHAHAGREEQALASAEQLKRLEPDFSIERLLRDESYPASLVRRSETLAQDRVAALI